MNGYLVIRILAISRVGPCLFLNPTAPTAGTLSLTFRACAVSYVHDDVLAGSVVKLAAENGNFVLQSEHANILVTSKSDAVELLALGSVVCLNIVDIYAMPGTAKFAIHAQIYTPPTTVSYYPIAAHEEIGRALARTSFVRVEEVARGGEIHECNIIEAAQSARAFLTQTLADVARARGTLPEVIRALFAGTGKEPTESTGSVVDLFAADVARVAEGTCVIVSGEFSPLDARVRVSRVGLANLPEGWILEGPAQSADMVIARQLERYIDFALTAATMAREFLEPAKLAASRSLIAYITNFNR